jgi:hypothetical protein
MKHRSMILGVAFLALAFPLSASQFIDVPFDEIARQSSLVVRGSVVNTWSAWDPAGEVIYTYATIRVQRYFGEATGPDVLTVREVGGTVDGYTMEAIGFPMIRQNEDVVMFLAPWDDGIDYRIHAFNQGKYLVRNRGGVEVLIHDPDRQGDERLDRDGRFAARSHSIPEDQPALLIEEFAQMVEAARSGLEVEPRMRQLK